MRANRRKVAPRAGAATLDYVLLLCVVMPMVVFLWTLCKGTADHPSVLQAVYEMTCVLVSWPFM
jgi:hypothetical protein